MTKTFSSSKGARAERLDQLAKQLNEARVLLLHIRQGWKFARDSNRRAFLHFKLDSSLALGGLDTEFEAYMERFRTLEEIALSMASRQRASPPYSRVTDVRSEAVEWLAGFGKHFGWRITDEAIKLYCEVIGQPSDVDTLKKWFERHGIAWPSSTPSRARG